MLGNSQECSPSLYNEKEKERYQRDFYTDMKIGIDCLKEFNDKLKTLHPDVSYKIRNLI